jgi:hypothetical protein
MDRHADLAPGVGGSCDACSIKDNATAAVKALAAAVVAPSERINRRGRAPDGKEVQNQLAIEPDLMESNETLFVVPGNGPRLSSDLLTAHGPRGNGFATRKWVAAHVAADRKVPFGVE